ncbi:hybrid sensor histidine kinase/response regulator [Halogeometricum sp. S1BR25-6]|uniref:Hybrid sensor histidine kinase/response regulator n=1 Tax=Halogeometricum salsisoli TaxID=2950536 RepID=A0ABU2GBY2_9EURY|nr:hybrid sensor histidine kinase/response regulator [Halogeometricum sp. S1BR25-6]MDS0297814.1 hybrid sensor histidine kinase/response regulator [Halogeometricum sp. S1BR25-6]
MERRVRVLFVEGDDDPTAVSAERLGDRDGIEVEGVAGWAAAGDVELYDCVVTNHALSDGDAVEVVRAVGAAAPRVPVVLYTAVGDERTAREALRAGAADYVVACGSDDRSDGGTGESAGGADAEEIADREAATLERRIRAAVSGGDRTVGGLTPTERVAELESLDRLFRHDIRNDMAVIVGWADVLRDHVTEEGEEILDRILDNGRHTLELTDVAGDAAATITDEAATAVEPTDLGEALREAVQSRREAFPRASIELGAVPACRVAANHLLGSVFRSLLNEAVSNYRGDTPTLHVSAERDGETVRVRVADADSDGAGVSAEPPLGTGTDLERSDADIDRYLVERLVGVYGGEVRVDDGAFVVELRARD